MALLKTQTKKRERVQIALFILIVIATGVVVYSGFFADSGSLPDELVIRPPGSVSDINFNVVDKGVIGLFKSWSSIPVEVGPTGKANPFSQ